MSTDYVDAATRHRSDADLLHDSKRWPNADQLYGLAAECALKAVMKALGMAVRADGAPLEHHHRVHIDKLWGEFLSLANGSGGASYAALLTPTNPFANWSVEQRYHCTSSIAQTTVEDHKNGTTAVFSVLSQARQDGRL
ncbi:MAG TPA: hypothetical protein P5234_15090 [Thermoanaerobaculaceae bacterium]|nr:hypothetical protein [Thermoanaerobaculaceae bacterium]